MLLLQVTSAREGVELLGSLIEKYGSAEGFGILFGDSNESWCVPMCMRVCVCVRMCAWLAWLG